jgi:hypothetical protein
MTGAARKRRERTWRPGADYRIVCDCQRHARARIAWRRTLRLASRGAAVLVSLPLAFAALDIPIEAMNLSVASISIETVRGMGTAVAPEVHAKPAIAPDASLRIFTRPGVSEHFLVTEIVPRTLTIDLFKEEYFRDHVPYGAIIYREARKNDLPPELVAAMVHTESDFRAGLVSHKSAQGLMQIIPDTARDLGVANPFDPEQNIAAGTKYYRYLLNRFDDERIALAAYNAGEGNVERFGGVPPFTETRDYIEKVHTRTSRYRQRVKNTYLAAVRVNRASAW